MNSWRRSARPFAFGTGKPRALAPATRVAERNGERSFRRSRPTRCAYCTGYSQLVALATTLTDVQYSTRVPQVNVLYFMKYSTFTCAVHKSCSVHGTRRGRRATRKQGPSACLRPRLLHGVDACDEVVHTALLWVDNAGSPVPAASCSPAEPLVRSQLPCGSLRTCSTSDAHRTSSAGRACRRRTQHRCRGGQRKNRHRAV